MIEPLQGGCLGWSLRFREEELAPSVAGSVDIRGPVDHVTWRFVLLDPRGCAPPPSAVLTEDVVVFSSARRRRQLMRRLPNLRVTVLPPFRPRSRSKKTTTTNNSKKKKKAKALLRRREVRKDPDPWSQRKERLCKRQIRCCDIFGAFPARRRAPPNTFTHTLAHTEPLGGRLRRVKSCLAAGFKNHK